MAARRVPRRLVLAIPLAVGAVGMSSCGFGGSETPGEEGKNGPAGNGTEVFRQASRPVNHLNPAFRGGGSPQATVMMAMMWEGLVRRDPADSQNYLPGAAEKWDVSEDGTTYTFHLRSGAKWTNGDPLTAHDFVWAFSYYYNATALAEQGDQNGPSHNGSLTSTNIKGMADYYAGTTTDFSSVGVTAVDDQTLEVVLTSPDYRFLDSLVGLYPLHEKSVTANVREFWLPDNFVGNGPYALTAYNQNSAATMELNPNYWDKAGFGITTREIQFNASGTTGMMVSYNSNEIDVFRVDGDPSALVSGRPDLAEQLTAGSLVQFKGVQVLPTRNAILQDKPKLRQALAMAVDREALATVSPPDVAGPSWVPSGITGADQLPTIPYDVDAARTLLAEAGHEGGAGVPELSILTYATMPMLEALASMWQENLGITTTVMVQEVGVYSKMSRGDLPDDFVGFSFNYQAPSPFNMMRYGGAPYFQDLFVPFEVKKQLYDLNHGKDKGKYSPAETAERSQQLREENWFPEYQHYMDLATRAQAAQADVAEATRIATQAAIALQETYIWIPLLWAGYTFMVKPRVKNLVLTSYPDDIYTLKGVELDPLD